MCEDVLPCVCGTVRIADTLTLHQIEPRNACNTGCFIIAAVAGCNTALTYPRIRERLVLTDIPTVVGTIVIVI